MSCKLIVSAICKTPTLLWGLSPATVSPDSPDGTDEALARQGARHQTPRGCTERDEGDSPAQLEFDGLASGRQGEWPGSLSGPLRVPKGAFLKVWKREREAGRQEGHSEHRIGGWGQREPRMQGRSKDLPFTDPLSRSCFTSADLPSQHGIGVSSLPSWLTLPWMVPLS